MSSNLSPDDRSWSRDKTETARENAAKSHAAGEKAREAALARLKRVTGGGVQKRHTQKQAQKLVEFLKEDANKEREERRQEREAERKRVRCWPDKNLSVH